MKLLFENLQTFLPSEMAGEYGIPVIKPTGQNCVNTWIGFNYALACKDTNGKGVHFFLDDTQICRLWNQPDKYLPVLKRFRAVCSPDFSTYTDMPLAMQIYNHYRKHWLAAYWQYLGINVIPTISWSDKNSFSWCFDGEPVRSVVAIGTTSTQKSKEAKAAFLDGYHEMMSRLTPTCVLVYGNIPKEIESYNLIKIGNFTDRFKKEVP